MNEKTRHFLTHILPPSLIGIALIVTALWGAARDAEAKSYRIATENLYRRAAYELSESINSMEADLAKLMVAGTPAQHVLLLDDLFRECGTAESLLSQIPASHGDAMELNRFLVRMGDYARALAAQVLRGETVSGNDKQQLHTLHETCAALSLSLAERMEEGGLPLAALTGEEYYTEAQPAEEGGDYQQSGIEEFPTLIYDGPFSESSEKQEPLGLPDGEVDETTALAVAQKLAGDGATLASSGLVEGDIPYWDLSGSLVDGREVSYAITKQGGKLLTMMTTASGSAEGVPAEDAAERYRDAAAKFLEELGFGPMQSTYAQYYAGTAVINFTAEQNGVLLYSDLVKVWVDREDGTVIGLDARNYWYSHRLRELPEPGYTRDEASAMVSDDLEIRSIRLAYIPVTPTTERLCYEFKGEYEGVSYIVYINALTLYEEQIFKILDSENGQLVI